MCLGLGVKEGRNAKGQHCFGDGGFRTGSAGGGGGMGGVDGRESQGGEAVEHRAGECRRGV